MSIINQMLQDLERRHAGGDAANNAAGQVRAVAHERKIHIAWFAVVVLTVLLCGVLAWLWWRPPVREPLPVLPQVAIATTAALADAADAADAASAVPASQLLLKSEQDLNANSPEVAADSTASEAHPAPHLLETPPITTPAVEDKVVDSRPLAKNENSQPDKAKSAVASLANSKPTGSQRTVEKIPEKVQMSAVEPVREATVGTTAMLDAPSALHKQVRQLTPQQQAENDFRNATRLAQQGRVSDAINLLEQVLQIDAHNATARQTLIALLLNSKRQEEAARRAQEGLNFDAKQTGFAMILARLQIEKGEQKLAINTLQQSLPYGQERAEYQAFLAALLQREGHHKEAVEQYLAAVRKAPENGLWWMGLGISLQAENRLAEAREAFANARESAVLTPDLLAFVEQKLKQLPR